MSFDIEKGKKRFLALLNEISSERKGIEPLVAWLEKGDFFSAPLTANQRGAYKGGLLEHSLNVYMAYMMLFVQQRGFNHSAAQTVQMRLFQTRTAHPTQ